jgi:uncharacterized membrane protein
MPFCPNCGSAVQGQFCARCGTNVSAASAAGSTTGAGVPPNTTAAAGGLDQNVVNALCYIPIVAVIFLLIEPYNRNRDTRFHAFQSLLFALAWFVIAIGMMILRLLLASVGIWGVGGLLGSLISLGLFLIWIVLVFKAFQNQRFVLPVIGPIAEKQA